MLVRLVRSVSAKAKISRTYCRPCRSASVGTGLLDKSGTAPRNKPNN